MLMKINPKAKKKLKKALSDESKKGLYYYMNAKRERIENGSGEKMNPVGSPDAPTDADFKAAAKTAKKPKKK